MSLKSPEGLTAPGYLAPDTRSWWTSVVQRWRLEEHHTRLLTLAAEAWDRGQMARTAILTDGLTLTTPDGGRRAHPAVAIERDSRLAFARLVRELDLDLEAPPVASRPAPLRSMR
jgi:phage terminase small subunit